MTAGELKRQLENVRDDAVMYVAVAGVHAPVVEVAHARVDYGDGMIERWCTLGAYQGPDHA